MCVYVCVFVTDGDNYFGSWSTTEESRQQPRNEVELDS